MTGDDSDELQRFHVGSTIAGRYRVERPIGEGAMGAVALARHVSLDETVAIKFLRPELRRDPVAIARLSREAKALARIKSDHVARVLDVGTTLSVGPYMVMEYLEGIDLGELLEQEGPLPVPRAVECMLQVCEALTVAHTAGIVHRDIKPQNLFLARHGQFETLKVLDFGICDGAPSATAAPGDGASYGTPSYMSPERVRNDPSADHRADIWSLGVVLHELVTGRAVFDGGELTDICARIVSDAPIELEQDAKALPAELRVIIARCLEREPARRYQSVEELAAALAPLGTMHERFRGRSTGAFSRQMLAAELARAQSLAPLSAPVGVAGGSVAAGWAQLASVLRGLLGKLARALPGVAPRRGLAALVALVVLVSLVRGAAWMAPPPSAPLAEPVRSAAVSNAASSAAAPFAAEAAATDGAGLDVSALPSTAPLAARAGEARRPAAVAESSRARSRRAELRRAARAPRARAARAAREAGADARAAEAREPRTSRVRLVDDKRSAGSRPKRSEAVANRASSAASGSSEPGPGEARGRTPSKAPPPR